MRAKEIVNQILTFTRQADIQTEPIQVSAIVKETLKLFTSSLPPNITVHLDIQSDAWTMADATHLHQVVMNLCTNARHAMSDTGGVLGVQLSEVQFDEDQLRLQLAWPDTRQIYQIVGKRYWMRNSTRNSGQNFRSFFYNQEKR